VIGQFLGTEVAKIRTGPDFRAIGQ